ncbi:hypothetical protein LSH36_101g01057 [Paralvinella palmiformis]|uniref:Uncharacterized protein n=1 Tax=Paralvinella palmiformis TaxID=53620 RepID=A0AAD9NCJ7_9ANNE|nr:hypothetical protein LSH36_101g01057 [Paralvinella palmiformis]
MSDHLNTILCSYLTCDNYWEPQEKEVNNLSYRSKFDHAAAVTLKSNPSLLDTGQNEIHQRVLRAPENQEIRYRLGVSVT